MVSCGFGAANKLRQERHVTDKNMTARLTVSRSKRHNFRTL
jgi:ribosomal protein L37E